MLAQPKTLGDFPEQTFEFKARPIPKNHASVVSVPQRSKKTLTIPKSPNFSTTHRPRAMDQKQQPATVGSCSPCLEFKPRVHACRNGRRPRRRPTRKRPCSVSLSRNRSILRRKIAAASMRWRACSYQSSSVLTCHMDLGLCQTKQAQKAAKKQHDENSIPKFHARTMPNFADGPDFVPKLGETVGGCRGSFPSGSGLIWLFPRSSRSSTSSISRGSSCTQTRSRSSRTRSPRKSEITACVRPTPSHN